MIFSINSINNSTATSSHNATAPNGVLDISNLQLLILLLSLVLVIFISHLLSLHIDKHLAIAATRCFLQLGALGFILVPILFFNNAPLVVVYIIFMMFVAAVEAASRPPYFFDSLLIVCFLSIFLTVSIFGIFTFFLVLRTGLDAQYAIPIVGMITGSAMSAVSVSVSNIVTNFAERKEEVEIFLALGATRWEAALQVIRSSVILGLTPTLNQMSVTGLVSIPGMMTGQIIGGTPPGLAAKYQLVIMYVGAGTATIATLSASMLTINALIDSNHRIRPELLIPRDSVNRFESILISLQYVASLLYRWRRGTIERASPFPTHVNEPLPFQHTPIPSHAKDEKSSIDYGSTSVDAPKKETTIQAE